MLCGHGMLVYVGYTLGLPVSPCSRDSALSARGGLDSAGHIRDGVSDRAVWPDGGCECTCTGTLLRCSVPTSFAPGALFCSNVWKLIPVFVSSGASAGRLGCAPGLESTSGSLSLLERGASLRLRMEGPASLSLGGMMGTGKV